MQKIRIKKKPQPGDQVDYSLVDRYGYSNGGTTTSTDDTVKNTLSAIPEEDANIEVEHGETVVGDVNHDGLVEHFEFKGKSHAQGGIPAAIPEGSFIFSNTKKLKIKDRGVQEAFGMSYKKEGYTPAEISKKYKLNEYINTLKSEDSDEMSKRSADQMVKNHMEKLGMLALVQESMKGFPDGIPAIAESALAGLQGQGQTGQGQQMPEAKYGGRILPKAQTGLSKGPDKSTGYWNRVANGNLFQRESAEDIDPRINTAVSKLNPFSDEVHGVGDYFSNLFTIPQKEVNHLLTGYYESPMDTKARYSKVSDNQHFWGDIATDPMMYPELPYAAGKGLVKVSGKAVAAVAPHAKQLAEITAKYGTKAAQFLGQYIGKMPLSEILAKGTTLVGRGTQAAMHANTNHTPIAYERLKDATINGKPGKIGLAKGKWYNLSDGTEITKFVKPAAYMNPLNPSVNNVLGVPSGVPGLSTFSETPDSIPTAKTPVPVKTAAVRTTPAKKVAVTKTAVQPSAPKATTSDSNYGWVNPNFEHGGELPMYQIEGEVKEPLVKTLSKEEIAKQRTNAPNPNDEVFVGKQTGPNGEEVTLYYKGDRKYAKNAQGKIVYEAPRTDAKFSQYGSYDMMDILAKAPNVNYTKTNFGAFGNQPSYKNTGIYLSSGNAQARSNGDLAPEEWQDFKDRHGDWIEKEYTGGFEKFKNDLKSSKQSGTTAAKWFQESVNDKTQKLYGKKWFGEKNEKTPYTKDNKFGQVTYSVPNFFNTPQPEPAPEKPVEKAPGDIPAQAELERTPVKNGPWWLQDTTNFVGTMTDEINRYEPLLGMVDLDTPGYVLKDPTRMLANNQESMVRFQNQAENTMDGNVAAATMLGATGEGLAQGANNLSQVESENVGIVNNAYANNAQMTNQEHIMNEAARQKYVGEMAMLNQNIDEDKNLRKWRQISAFNKGTENWHKKKLMEQVLFPQVYLGPITGDAEYSGRFRDPIGPNTYSPAYGKGTSDTGVDSDALIDDYMKNKGMKFEEAEKRARLAIDSRKKTGQSYTDAQRMAAMQLGLQMRFGGAVTPWDFDID